MNKFAICLVVLLAGCGESAPQGTNEEGEGEPSIPDGATVIAVGDSILAWFKGEEASILDVVGERLGVVTYNAAVEGAYFTVESGWDGEDIPGQYVDGDWQWLVLDGGGNDFNDECGCDQCGENMDEIVSADGTAGALPDFVDTVVGQGVRVVIMGYYSVPPTAEYGFDLCGDTLSEYSQRQLALANTNDKVWFLDGSQVIDSADLSLYDEDHVHPSEQGIEVLGNAIADLIAAQN